MALARAVPIALAAAGTALMIAACGSSSGPISTGPEPTTRECAQVAELTVPEGSSVVALVADNTASNAPGSLPPAIAEAIRTAQAEGSALWILPVAGAEQRPTPVHRIMLDPYPGEDSPAATEARRIAVACVTSWAKGERAWPAAPGSAVLEAIAAASRERPARILVASDGLSNSGAIDLNRLGFDADPVALAAELDRSGAIDPHLAEMEIVWAGLGDSVIPLPQPVRDSLRALWDQVLTGAGATVEFDSRTAPAGRATPPEEDLPEDGVQVPALESVALPCGVQVTVPSALLFGPDSARLLDGSTQVLREPAGQLAAHPDWTATVSGHTADFGTEQGRLALSQERAAVVKGELVRLGARDQQIKARGYGATRPAPTGEPGSGPGGDSPARHRRVVIEIHQTGCDQ